MRASTVLALFISLLRVVRATTENGSMAVVEVASAGVATPHDHDHDSELRSAPQLSSSLPTATNSDVPLTPLPIAEVDSGLPPIVGNATEGMDTALQQQEQHTTAPPDSSDASTTPTPTPVRREEASSTASVGTDPPPASAPSTTAVEEPSSNSSTDSTHSLAASSATSSDEQQRLTPTNDSTTTKAAASAAESSLPSPVQAMVTEEVLEAPEFLSFNEWKDRYVVVAADASATAARRSKKTAQRARQDAQGASASFDGDGADLGSLFANGGSEEGSGSGEERSAEEFRAGSSDRGTDGGDIGASTSKNTSDTWRSNVVDSLNVPLIQPLPNVGTGESSDPLLSLKDRSNYAAFECAALVHRTSRQSKGSSSILIGKKDRYMLTPCSADPKFVEVELCEEIQIDTIVLANFELFSSMFKHFEMTCSADYPGRPETWHNLGTFRARNARGMQVFRTNPIPQFCRYVRVNFLSHYGSEYYCPVSLLRVYGYTQLGAYHESVRKAKELEAALASALEETEADEEEEKEEEEEAAPPTPVPTPVLTPPTSTEPTATPACDPATAGQLETTKADAPHESTNSTVSEARSIAPASEGEARSTSGSADGSTSSTHDSATEASATMPSSSSTETGKTTQIDSVSTTSVGEASATTSTKATSSISSDAPPATTVSIGTETPVAVAASLSTAELSTVESLNQSATTGDASAATSATPEADNSTITSATATVTATGQEAPATDSSSSTALAAANATSTLPSVEAPTSAAAASSNGSASWDSPTPAPAVSSGTTTARTQASETPIFSVRHLTRNESARPMPPLPQVIPQQPQPGESIYATIMKRLTTLEQDHTIAMHYIEAQSTMLRDAFLRVERRLKDVEGMHLRQDQSFRTILVELEKQRLDIESERLSLAAQVTLLAQEVRLEKRLSIAELFGLLALVVFVVATRGSPTSTFMHLTSAQVLRRAPAQADAKRHELDEKGRAGPTEPRTSDTWEEQHGTDRERTRKVSASRNGSLTLGRMPSLKRTSVSSKGAPRRHYGNGSSSRTPVLKSGRTWTPPLRHSSAPPEDPFESFVINADGPIVSGSRSLYRKGSKKTNGVSAGGNGSRSLFPSDGTGLGLHPSALATDHAQFASRLHQSNVKPPDEISDDLQSDDQFSTTTSASEATQPRYGVTEDADDERGARYSDDDEDDDMVLPSPPLPIASESRLGSMTSQASPSPPPPQQPSPKRPSPSPRHHSSPSIPFPSVDATAPEPPVPASRLPSPPPEPVESSSAELLKPNLSSPAASN